MRPYILKIYQRYLHGKSSLLCFFFLFSSFNSFGQDTINTALGAWRGTVRQDGTPIWNYKVAFTVSPGYTNEVIGVSKYLRSDGGAADFRFEGTMDGNSVIITEKEVKKSTPATEQWCLKRLRLTFTHNGKTGIDSLRGTWEGVRVYDAGLYFEIGVMDNKGVVHKCSPGVINLWRKGKKDSVPPAIAAAKPVVVPLPANKPAAKLKSSRPRDGYYDLVNMEHSRPSNYAPLREADVAYLKRVWRDFDLREKSNTYLASPKARLIDVLLDGVNSGELQAYDPQGTKDDPGGDSFSQRYTVVQAMARLSDSSLVTRRDKDNNIISAKMEAGIFNPDSIVRFRIKEDWVFDKQRSVFEPRIIGLAPLISLKSAAGIITDTQPAFWIYFPQARPLLAKKEIAVEHNDHTGLSFDDAFMKRMFNSYVIKVSNDKDERIKDYMQGLDRLYESQRISKALMDWELNLWQW